MAAKHWPVDSQRLWAETTRWDPAERPAPPPWDRFEDFKAHVPVARNAGSAWTLMFFAILPTIWAVKRHLDEEPNVVFTMAIAAVAALMFFGGIFWLVWDRVGRERRLRRIHRRVLARALTVHAYPTSFTTINHSENGPRYDQTMLLVDARLSDAAASRLHGVFTAWCEWLKADEAAESEARDAIRHRDVVTLTEIFGPAAEGAWLAKKTGQDTPWRLFLPHAKHLEISDIMSLVD